MRNACETAQTLLPFTRALAAAACLLLAMPIHAWSQTHLPAPIPPRVTATVDLSGPRFGITMLSDGNVNALKERGYVVRPLVSQFGWQFERRFYSNGDGTTALSEWVPLISGLEQGVALPSLNWLVGLRTSTGKEFGIGPNVTLGGVGLVIVGGVTLRSGAMNVPVNVAVTTSKSGARLTILTGFTLRR
jgi:hypothetical protein